MAGSTTTAIITATICRSGCGCGAATVRGCCIWWCRTRSTATTCASRYRRGSAMAFRRRTPGFGGQWCLRGRLRTRNRPPKPIAVPIPLSIPLPRARATRPRPGRCASAGHGCSSACSTSTCSAARTAAAANSRSSRRLCSGRFSRRSCATWGWIRSPRPSRNTAAGCAARRQPGVALRAVSGQRHRTPGQPSGSARQHRLVHGQQPASSTQHNGHNGRIARSAVPAPSQDGQQLIPELTGHV